MFDRLHIICIYQEGSDQVLMSFSVSAVCVEVKNHHTLKIDGKVLQFDEKHYVTVTKG